jgi:hypothetical protein
MTESEVRSRAPTGPSGTHRRPEANGPLTRWIAIAQASGTLALSAYLWAAGT